MTPYTPNPLTRPIRTPFPTAMYVLAGVVLVGSLFVSAFATRQVFWVKWAIILTPLVLLVLREFYRQTRRLRIKTTRLSTAPPYSWKIETAQPDELSDIFPVDMSIIGKPGLPLLLLIEKQEEEDHQAHLYELFYQSLKKTGIPLSRFYHKGDLRVFWNEEHRHGLPLQQLAQTYKNYQPILCGDGLRAVNHEKEELQVWTYAFYAWKHRIILTNRLPSEWDLQEDILKNCFTLVPYDREGLFSLVNFFSGRIREIDFQRMEGPLQPEMDANDPQIIVKLEAAFGPDLTRWIAAAALSTKLDWDLTLKTGQYLSNGKRNLVTWENIAQLSRIPWFRTGEIPDTVRQKLAAYLDAATVANVRRLMVETLEENPPRPGSHAHNSFRMELAGLKALIPGFPQAGLKNELYELKSMGYQEDVLVTDWIESQKYWFDRLVPDSLERVAYTEGFFLLGRSLWFFLPLLLLFAGGVLLAPIPGILLSPPNDNVSVPTDTTGQEERIPAATFIGGRVTGLEDEIIPNVSVTLPDIGEKGAGDASGQFRLDIPGTYNRPQAQLLAEAQGYLPVNQLVTVGDGQLVIRMVPAWVTIRVKDGATGLSIRDAIVHFENNDYRTDASGNARIILPEKYSDRETMQFTIKKTGYQPELLEKTERIARQINVALFPKDAETMQLRGRVFGENINPLPGVQVNTRFGNARSGDGGNFVLTVPGGESVQADFVHRDYQPKSQALYPGRMNEVVLTRKQETRFFQFSGLVKDKCTGVALPRVTFEIGDMIRSNSRSDGAFSFQLQGNEQEIRRLTAVFTLENYYPERIQIAEFASGSPKTINLSPKVASGIVLDAKGNRVADALVSLRGAGETRTDARGGFRFENLPANAKCPLSISVEKSGYPAYRGDFISGDQIRLGESAPQSDQFSGRVTDRCTDAGIPKAAVSIYRMETVYTDNQGYFKMGAGQQPNVTVEVKRGDDYFSFSKSYDSSELANGVNIQLTPRSLQGKVVDEKGRPISGASISLSDDRKGVTDDYGRFTLPHSEKFECRAYITVEKPEFNSYEGLFTPGQEIRLKRQ